MEDEVGKEEEEEEEVVQMGVEKVEKEDEFVDYYCLTPSQSIWFSWDETRRRRRRTTTTATKQQ